MPKVAIIDDEPAVTEMLAAALLQGRHELMTSVTPIRWEAIVHFGPQVVALGLARKRRAFNRPVGQAVEDITGYQALIEAERYPAIHVLPMMLVGMYVEEQDVPTTVDYDMFLTFPEDMGRFAAAADELACKVKTRRKISGYVCPAPGCGSRLVFLRHPARDLFCPKCHTAVTLIEGEGCLAMNGHGGKIPCSLDMLAPQRRPPPSA